MDEHPHDDNNKQYYSDVGKLILLKQTGSTIPTTTNPILLTLRDCVLDHRSRLSLFLAFPHILQLIWNHVVRYWEKGIQACHGVYEDDNESYYDEARIGVAYHLFDEKIKFPKPKDLYVTMMPFIMERTFEKCKLPKYLKPYWDNVINVDYFIGNYPRQLIRKEERGKVGFLTIHESYVKKDETQGWAGVRTHSPGKLTIVPDGHDDNNGNNDNMGLFLEKEIEIHDCKFGGGTFKQTLVQPFPWGWGGDMHGEYYGGIYIATSVNNKTKGSCRVWECRVSQSVDNGDEVIGEEVIGSSGNCEHLREFLPASRETKDVSGDIMEDSCIYWITDRTPLESIPMDTGCYRQYFRMFTSDVSVWFEDYSTKNPLGVMPDPSITKIVREKKCTVDVAILLDLDMRIVLARKEKKRERKESAKRIQEQKPKPIWRF